MRHFKKVSNITSLKRWNEVQRRIGITGGIASGKTVIGKYLTDKKNIPILDADIYSKEALGANQDSTKKVIKRYGSLITNRINGVEEINRNKLGKIIFSNNNEKIWLEKLLHPIIREKFEKDIYKFRNYPIICLIIPLLFEANFTNLCTETWLIYCSKNKQLERLMERNQYTYQQAMIRIKSQYSLEEKKKLASQMIDNSNDLTSCFKQIDLLL